MAKFDRRRFLKGVGLASGTAAAAARVSADPIHKGSRVIEAGPVDRGPAALFSNGKVIRPRHEVPVMRETDVLVVGGGCAGAMAALAAARTGASVTIVERYGCFGGLWTAGLVLIVLATHARAQSGLTKCVRGIGDELLERLTKIPGGIINQGPGKRNPTSDPEATKYLLAVMLREAGVDILLHSWATNAVMEGSAVRGVIFESKSGCRAIRAKVVVDATGDGDVIGAAGAEHARHVHKIGLVHRLGNADRVTGSTARLGSATPLPSVKWVNMQGPSGDCLDVETLTRCELDGREAVWKRLKRIQEKPGHEKIFLLDTASQLGVRASRTLRGTYELKKGDTEKTFADTVAVAGGDVTTGGRSCRIPYGALTPVTVDNLLAAGRCVSADNHMLNYTRLIGPCLVTGHAAGAAAALAAAQKTGPRDVAVPTLRKLLEKQGAYLG